MTERESDSISTTPIEDIDGSSIDSETTGVDRIEAREDYHIYEEVGVVLDAAQYSTVYIRRHG